MASTTPVGLRSGTDPLPLARLVTPARIDGAQSGSASLSGHVPPLPGPAGGSQVVTHLLPQPRLVSPPPIELALLVRSASFSGHRRHCQGRRAARAGVLSGADVLPGPPETMTNRVD